MKFNWLKKKLSSRKTAKTSQSDDDEQTIGCEGLGIIERSDMTGFIPPQDPSKGKSKSKITDPYAIWTPPE